MRGLKNSNLAPLALLPRANAQISVNIGAPPVCSYGYYDYSPYALLARWLLWTGLFL
jgi:hypothetical protein